MIKSIKKFFSLINRSLDGIYNVTDEVINWSDELVEESRNARAELAKERASEV